MRQFMLFAVALTAFGVMLTAAQADISMASRRKKGVSAIHFQQQAAHGTRDGGTGDLVPRRQARPWLLGKPANIAPPVDGSSSA